MVFLIHGIINKYKNVYAPRDCSALLKGTINVHVNVLPVFYHQVPRLHPPVRGMSPVMAWHPIQGDPCLVPRVSLDKLEVLHNPVQDK